MTTRLPSYPATPVAPQTVNDVRPASNGAQSSGSGGGGAIVIPRGTQFTTALPSRANANAIARRASEYQQTTSALGAVARLVYGEQIIGAELLLWYTDGDYLYLSCGWCLGEIDSVVEIYLNDEPLPGTVAATHYTGTLLQGVDPTIASVVDDYYDTNIHIAGTHSIGLAYSVLKIPVDEYPAMPSVKGKIKGLKVNAGAWTDTPAYFLKDIIENNAYGIGGTVDSASFAALVAHNTAALSDGNARCKSGITIDTQLAPNDLIDLLRNYCECYVINDGGVYYTIPDAAASIAHTFTDSDIVAGSMRISKSGAAQRPSVVTVWYTNTDEIPWRDDYARVISDDVENNGADWNDSAIRLPGIQRHSQAHRVAVYRYNSANLSDLRVEFETFDEGLAVQIGDVISVTHSYGLSAKPIRVLSVTPLSPGRYRISGAEYTVLAYSDDVVSRPRGIPDTHVFNFRAFVAGISLLALTAESGTDQLIIGADGSIVSRIRFTWVLPSHPFPPTFEVRYKPTAATDWVYTSTAGQVIYLSPVSDGVEYTIEIRVEIGGYRSAWQSITHTVIGKTAPPGDITWARLEGDWLYWENVSDLDLAGYLVRWHLGTHHNFSNGSPLNTVPITQNPFRWRDGVNSFPFQNGQPVTLMVAAVDTSGNIGGSAYVTANLGDRIVRNLVQFESQAEGGWAGSITNGTVIDGEIYADSSAAAWSGDDNAAAWSGDDNTPAWSNRYANLVYKFAFYPDAKGYLNVNLSAVGAPVKLEYGIFDTPAWSGNDSNPAWTSDSNPAWSDPTWRIWQRTIEATASIYLFRISCGASTTRGVIQRMNVSLDMPDYIEYVNDFYVAASGDRLPISGNFLAIKNISITLQDDGGGADNVRILDKSATLGPLVQPRQGAVNTFATVDATIQGVPKSASLTRFF